MPQVQSLVPQLNSSQYQGVYIDIPVLTTYMHKLYQAVFYLSILALICYKISLGHATP